MRRYGTFELVTCQLITILICLVGNAQASLDAPHDTLTGTGCLSCHQMNSTYPKLLPPLNHTPLPGDIDDTSSNGLCWSCHNETIAPNVKTHSSLTTSTKYGDWTVECWVCHNQHLQEQKYNDSTYGKYIRRAINLANIKGGDGNTLGKTGIKSVVFKGQTGTNSFADGEGTLDGICEVCHTMTSHFRNDGSGPDQFHANINSGQAGANCIPCHNHANGFVHGSGGGAGKACVECHTHSRAKIDDPACESCHYANVAVEHVLSRGFTCTVCHENFCGTGACPESASDAGVVNAMNTARSGSDILCSTCHDTPHFTVSGSFVTAHHETSSATAGNCTRCHVVGPGIDGPPKGPCTVCHGDSGRFPYRHTNASTVDLARAQDNRVCFSCHLEGGQGYQVGVTPLVTPMHAWSIDPLWPGDCWNSAAKDPVNGISGLPACSTMGVPGSYQAENYMQTVTTGQWTGPAGNTPEDQLLKRYPGFGTFHYNYDILGPSFSTYDSDNAEGKISVDGTIMDTNPSYANTTKSSWGAGFVRSKVDSIYEQRPFDFVSVPITIAGKTDVVPSFDGIGGGGKPTATNSISATMTALDTAGNATALPAGAAWRLDGGLWQESGAVLANRTVRPGHRIEYKPVAGWTAPWSGSVPVPGSTVAAYEQCPDDVSVTITGPTSLTWDDPAAQEPYSVTGWLPADGAVHWELDTGGSDGFTITQVDATSAVIKKTGATMQGTYTFTLTAAGSTCFGNSATTAITVDVPANGAADPAAPTGEGIFGDAVIDSADIAGTPTDGRDLIQVAGTTFAFASTRTNVGTIKTFTIAPDGQMTGTVLNSVTFPVTVLGYYQWARHISITRVASDLFAAVSGNTLQLLRISAAGQITLLGSSTWNTSDEQLRYILPLRNGLFVVASNRMLGTVSITEAGVISWRQTSPIAAYNGSWFTENSRFFDLAPVAGDVYAVFFRTSASSKDFLKVRTLHIDASGNFTHLQTYSIPAVYRYGSVDDCESSMLRVGDGVFALAYADRQDADYIRTLAIAPDGAIAEPGLINFLSFQHSYGRKPLLSKISGNVYAAITKDGYGNVSKPNIRLSTYTINDRGIITARPIDTLKFNVPDPFNSFKKLKLIPVAGDVYAFTEGNGTPVYTFTITADADDDGLFNSADCNDNDNSIGLAPDGTCDGDQDGLIDPAGGGTDCDDNNPAITVADDGTCDGDSDGLIDWTADGIDCNDSNDTIGAAPDGTCDGDSDGFFDSAVTGGTDCNDNNVGIGMATDGTCDGDGDGAIDWTAGGTDCNDNDSSFTTAADGNCDGDNDDLIDRTAGGTDCDDNNAAITAAGDGTCDSDSDGAIDWTAGGADCNDNDSSLTTATDGTCDGDSDGLIDLTAGGTDCDDNNAAITAVVNGTCDDDSDGLIDLTAGGTDCDDNNTAFTAADDGTCDGDGDGAIDWTAGGTDCNDNESSFTTAADTTCDGDSDGAIDWTAGGTDCNDNDAAITTAADTTCDGDGDTSIDWTAGGHDCNDNDAGILPPCSLTGNSTGYTSTTLTDSTANWKPNMFTGMSVTYHVTQTVCGYGCTNTEHSSTRTVISNTNNSLTVDSAWDFTTGFTPKEYTITLP
jgi:hypothetical protein